MGFLIHHKAHVTSRIARCIKFGIPQLKLSGVGVSSVSAIRDLKCGSNGST